MHTAWYLIKNFDKSAWNSTFLAITTKIFALSKCIILCFREILRQVLKT